MTAPITDLTLTTTSVYEFFSTHAVRKGTATRLEALRPYYEGVEDAADFYMKLSRLLELTTRTLTGSELQERTRLDSTLPAVGTMAYDSVYLHQLLLEMEHCSAMNPGLLLAVEYSRAKMQQLRPRPAAAQQINEVVEYILTILLDHGVDRASPGLPVYPENLWNACPVTPDLHELLTALPHYAQLENYRQELLSYYRLAAKDNNYSREPSSQDDTGVEKVYGITAIPERFCGVAIAPSTRKLLQSIAQDLLDHVHGALRQLDEDVGITEFSRDAVVTAYCRALSSINDPKSKLLGLLTAERDE